MMRRRRRLDQEVALTKSPLLLFLLVFSFSFLPFLLPSIPQGSLMALVSEAALGLCCRRDAFSSPTAPSSATANPNLL